MESGSKIRRRYAGAFIVLLALLGGLFGVVGPLADAAPVNPGTVGNFEIDGDQISAEGGTVDWVDFANLTDAFDADSLTVMTDAINPDNGLQGSSDENDPEQFSCQDKSPTVTPGKDNIVRAYFNTRVTGPASMFLDLGFVRDDGGVQGDSHINFEFNQNPITNLCPYTSRSAGDILISFDFPGNTALPADVNLFKWDPTIDESPKPDGAWVPFAFAGAIAAEDNVAQINDQIVGGTIAARAFGEASVDLFALIQAAGGFEECASFGFASVRSRSSGESFNSALQDILGGPVDITTCGKVVVKKQDDAGNNLPNATFGLWPSNVAVPPVVGGTRASTGSIATCTSIADGTCTFDDIEPGSYKVAELTPPPGYDIDIDVVDVTVVFRDTTTVALPFVDPKDTGSVTITKRIWDDKNGNTTVDDGEIVDLKVSGGVVYNDLDHNGTKSANEPTVDLTGITFKLLSGGVQANTWPPPGNPAQCTIQAGALSCTVGPVVLGSYTITEVIDPAKPLPDGVSKGPDVPVTLPTDDQTVSATFTNPVSPLNINLQKSGPATANVGDTYTYQFDVSTTGPRLHDVTVVELLPNRCNAGAITGPNKSVAVDPQNDADEFLEVGETWRWTCQHLVTAADGESIHNEARATGTDDLGRQVSDDDPHDVDVLLPDLSVLKLAADGVDDNGDPSGEETIDAPGTATFTITVDNVGLGIARNATLDDFDLPDGSWTVSLADADGNDDCPVGDGNVRSGSFSCTFGDLAPADAPKVITVSREVTLANDCAEALVNNVRVTTTYQEADIDPNASNDESDATIHVRCPDAGVVKQAVEPIVDAGNRAEWTITVTNHGAGSATGVFIVDDLPGGLTDWQVTGPDAASCGVVLGTLSCNFGTLAGGDTATITISGLTDPFDCGIVSNTVDLVDSEANDYEDTNDLNDSSTDSLDVRCPIEIDLDKTGDTIAHVGDTVDYEFTVTNTGGEDLVNVELTDPECNEGTIVLVDDADGAPLAAGTWDGDSFEGGEVWAYTCQRTIAAEDVVLVDGQAFALNTGTVTAEDADERSVEDTDPHEVLIITPDIEIVKTVDDDTPLVGQTVTYTYVVTNTGDTTLFGVDVVDDILGDIGTIDELEPGESATLTKDMVVAADSPTLNVATADGEDVLGKHVDDDDDAEITIVEAEVIKKPQALPATGSDIDRLLTLAGLLLLVGGALVLTGSPMAARARRRRH